MTKILNSKLFKLNQPVVEHHSAIPGKVENFLELRWSCSDKLIQSLAFLFQIIAASEEDNHVLVHALPEVVDKVIDGLPLFIGVPPNPGDKDDGVGTRS